MYTIEKTTEIYSKHILMDFIQYRRQSVQSALFEQKNGLLHIEIEEDTIISIAHRM